MKREMNRLNFLKSEDHAGLDTLRLTKIKTHNVWIKRRCFGLQILNPAIGVCWKLNMLFNNVMIPSDESARSKYRANKGP
jgi:hypothetical protein